MKALEALGAAVPQLKHIGSFNPANLEPESKNFLMRTERVFIDAYAGRFKEFFGAAAIVYQDAKRKGQDPEQAIVQWIDNEVRVLKEETRINN